MQDKLCVTVDTIIFLEGNIFKRKIVGSEHHTHDGECVVQSQEWEDMYNNKLHKKELALHRTM